MKFSRIALALTSVLSYAVTVSGEAEDAEVPQNAIPADGFEPTTEKPFNFRVEYLVKGKQDAPSEDTVLAVNGETIALNYQFHSGEEEDCSIVGVGGKLISPVTGELKANITANQIGPLSVSNNETVNFIQNVGIDVSPDTYLLVPAIYIVYQQQFMVLGARNQLVQVDDPKISFFNPKLILSELALLATVAGLVYVIYVTVGKDYLKGVLPAALKTPIEKPSTAAAKKSTASTTSSGFDKEWLPETHLKAASRRTRRTK
ncbi:DEKNAAC104605 [Brettanomyces naardenensis]|uniref:DEKNAAC104605 n=1 Tax=Brettanomyces naardenensis TaxID=13370 RepID=A0A448YRK5_BRENA|nr:DEKNAAC104605 [Brettanomyces naardenensis]